MTIFECVYYRQCNCHDEFCPGEKVTVLFQHKSEEECRRFMLLESVKDNVIKIKEYIEDKNKIDIFIQIGRLKGIKKLRVQELE